MSLSNSKLRRFAGNSAFAIMDQGLFAFSNFTLNILLARWLGAEGYGAFSVAFAVFLFVGMMYSSLVIEPMLVFGSGRYRNSQRSYISILLRFHWTYSTVACASLVLLSLMFYWGTPSSHPILILAPISVLILYQWLFRRACYLNSKPQFAAESGMVYLTVMLSGILLLQWTIGLSSITGFLTVGIASIVSGEYARQRLIRSGSLSEGASLGTAEVGREHWKYGKWALTSGMLGWIPGNVAMLILPVWGGMQASGNLKGAANLILPIQQVLAAAGPLLLPFLVRHRSSLSFKKKVYLLAIFFALPPLLWTLFLAFTGPVISEILYAGEFEIPQNLLLLLGFTAAIAGSTLVLAAGLRAVEKPKSSSYGYAASCFISLLPGIPLMAIYGVTGAAIGALAAVSTNLIVTSLVFRQTNLEIGGAGTQI